MHLLRSPGASQGPPPSALAPDLPACPRCGTSCEPDQEYCLECGARLPWPRGPIVTLGRAWQSRLPWYPGDWIWPTTLLLVIAALGGAVAYLVTESKPARQAIIATTASATGTGTPVTTGPAGTTQAAGTGTATAASLVTWPAGKSGYTTVLQSVPQRLGRNRVLSVARRAIAAGLPQVGYLNSSKYAALQPGYYVVFSGIFDSEAAAESNVSTASSRGFSSAYARQLAP
jgi:hypothetical protein